MSTEYTTSYEGGVTVFKVNDKTLATVDGRRVEPETPGPYFDADDHGEAMDGARAVAEAYAAGYDAGVADGGPVTVRRVRAIVDEQITKALDGLTVEVKR
ncbi:hypothetical protein [Mycobacteroides chelonae]|uniref:hypothetical protein n=1 Tax=Mycobacteroides chelonae TaxID=1774 RepID=UPI0009929A8D|nr:hypothetical protein [Mycobacteroides chelonae]